MADSDTPQAGPLTIEDMLAAKYPDSDEGTTEEVESEDEAPTVDEETLETDADAADADEEEDVGDPEVEASEEPQHLTLDDYGDLTVPVIINGEEQRVTLKEAAKGYQLQSDYTRKAQGLKAREKEIEAQLQEQTETLAAKQRELDKQLAGVGEEEPDWLTLSREDPLEYVALLEEWKVKRANQSEARERLTRETQQQAEKFKRMTAEKAVEVMPEWTSTEVFQKNVEGRRKAALDAGFTNAEYEGAMDFRLSVLLEKASRYDALQQGNTAIDKKIAKAPKVLKPGKSQSTKEVQAADRTALKRKLAKPHTLDEHLRAVWGE